jgi:hypothetical protein
VQAHEEWKAKGGRRSYRRREAAVDAQGRCIAERHGTILAYIDGCRCPESVQKFTARQARYRQARDRERDLRLAHEAFADGRRVKRLTGGRLQYDPRRPFRAGRWRVDGVMVRALAGGARVIGTPTHGDLLAAVARLEGWRVPNGPLRSRPATARQIAERIGSTERTVLRLREQRRRLATDRTARRLADARWRAAYVAAGVDRRAGRG